MADVEYKAIRKHVSQGWDWEDFEAKYSLTKDQLKEHIARICRTKSWAKSIIRGIERNAKRKAKMVKGAENAGDKNLDAKSTADTADTAANLDVEKSNSTNIGDVLADLRNCEGIEHEIVINLKMTHKGLVRQHRESLDRLRSIEREVKDIQKMLLAKGEEYDRVVSDIDEIIEQMRATSSERREHVARLDGIRQRIARLEKATLCAYTDGTIAPYYEDCEVALDDTGYEALLPELIVAEACQDLRAKDLRVLARLILIERNAKKSGVTIEVISEIEGLEKALETLRTA